MTEEELIESFWLCSISGIGPKSIAKLLKEAGDILKVKALTNQQLTRCVGAGKAELFLSSNTKQARLQAQEKLVRFREEQIGFLPLWHPEYPLRLKTIPDPPVMLFFKGRLPKKGQKQTALIGTRACSAYGAQMAGFFADRLARAGIGIVSGMARGIDSIAQEAALKAGQSSVAVLGCGVDICYPPENRALYERLVWEGCLISEYPPQTRPQPRLFPPRNRIISGLSDLVLVVEAREKSGTLITVDMALEQGREVFAVPGRVQDPCSQGCNRLIASGAGIATGPESILDALGCVRQLSDIRTAKNHRPLTDRVLAVLGSEALSLDEISMQSGIELSELMQELMQLYMEGIVTSCGGRYSKCFSCNTQRYGV